MSREAAFQALRLAEIDAAIQLLRRRSKTGGELLEIGAGTGWQAKALSEAGYRVEAIDLPEESAISGHARNRHWPIRDYDGEHIPFPDDSFDIVYSSNVLEHVEQLDELTAEIRRVLRPGGIALHLLPNPQWRIISLLTYYPGQAIDLLRVIRRQADNRGTSSADPAAKTQPRQSMLKKIGRRIVPPTHGAVGSPLSEIKRFSKSQWDGFFKQRGWEIVEYGSNGLLASGDYLLGTALPIRARRRLGRMMGGIAHVYLLRPMEPAE